MIKGMLSIIIPNRNEQFLKKTVDDLLTKAEESVEVIIVLDGCWIDVEQFTDKRIKMIHHGTERDSKGMRASINAGVAVSQGEFIMKLDGHCMMSQGYDVELKKTITETEEDRTHWVVIPRRHRLDPEKWEIANGGKPPIDYMAIDDPLRKFNPKGIGLHGHIWQQRYHDRKDIVTDETPSFQGSCYFLTRKHWDEIVGPLDDENYEQFKNEAQEIGFKTWFSGGKVMVRKTVEYSHLHKGSKWGKNYGFSNEQYKKYTSGINKGRIFCNNYWLNTKDYEHDFDWFLEQFPDMPGWGKGWRKRLNKALKKEGLIK